MLRAEFDHILREAQVGRESAFARLWRDANPMMSRYLRVAGVADPRPVARETWALVIDELRSFSGDEIDWRAWLLACCRRCVDDSGRRRARGLAPLFPSRQRERQARTTERATFDLVEPVERRGVNDTITAIRELPVDQGEILMLRLVGDLPVAKVAELVGTDVVAVRRSEDQAVERLGAERELIAWSLAAAALPEELGDQQAVLALFRGQGAGRSSVSAPGLDAEPESSVPSSATVVSSRTALLCIGVISASAMSVGGLSAAAYVQILPSGLQRAMHNAIGAPAPVDTTHAGSPAVPRRGAPPHSRTPARTSDGGSVTAQSRSARRAASATTTPPAKGRSTPSKGRSTATPPSVRPSSVKPSSGKPQSGKPSSTASAPTPAWAGGPSTGAPPASAHPPQSRTTVRPGASASAPRSTGHPSAPATTGRRP